MEKRRAVFVFEGWDAAGKGGAIKRLTALMDPRGYKVWPIAAPGEEERSHHYLWRFATRMPSKGTIAVFDRSWYGRVRSSASRVSPARRNGNAPTTRSTASSACTPMTASRW